MKYLVVAFTLIFSMTGSVNAEDNNNRWVVIISQSGHDGTYTSLFQSLTQAYYPIGALTQSECYENLKKDALWRNKTSSAFKGENSFRIEIVDDVVISAIAFQDILRFEMHCVQIWD